VGDAWFGSVRTSKALMSKGLYSVLNVKQGHAGYPKQEIKSALKVRLDTKWFTQEVDVGGQKYKLHAGGHMDKAPLMLAATCSTSQDGKTAVRHHAHLKDGKIVKKKYELQQPKMHELYRSYIHVVDCCNKVSLGHGNVCDVWQSKKVHHRLFAALLAITETNAYHAYLMHRSSTCTYNRHDWHKDLSDALLNNAFVQQAAPQGVVINTTVAAHIHLVSEGDDRKKVCRMCKSSTRFRCICGLWCCSPNANRGRVRNCFARHVADMLNARA